MKAYEALFYDYILADVMQLSVVDVLTLSLIDSVQNEFKC